MASLRTLLAPVAAALVTSASAPAGEPQPTLERLSPRLAVARTGATYADQLIAVAGSSGVAVIDTGIAPSLTRRYRALVEAAFDRKDFAWVVNTHHHHDHTNGNGAFPEARVVGHELTLAGMEQGAHERSQRIASERGRIAGWKERLATLDPASGAAARERDVIFLYSTMCDDFERPSAPTPPPPSVTFSERLTIGLGDLTLRLFYFGGGVHSGDGVVAWVPEEGLVAVGDVLAAPTLLQVESMESDVERQVAVLDEILRDRSKVRWVLTTHHEPIRPEELAARRDYLSALLDELGRASRAGLSLAEAARKVDLQGERFASVRALGLPAPALAAQHERAVRAVWFHIRDGRPAAPEIERALAEGGVSAALQRFEELLPLRDDRYDFAERDLNNLGYRRLAAGDVEGAVAVLEINTRLFPESSNVHDSLGEALASKGECRRAIASYERSLARNPQNTHATEQLARLRRECSTSEGR